MVQQRIVVSSPIQVPTTPLQETENYLAAMTQMENISQEIHTVSYIWGGLAVDIYRGCFLRTHSDIDYFVVNLHGLHDSLSELLLQQGWQVKSLLDGYLLSTQQQNVKLHLGHIDVGQRVSWKHNGNQGTICFPSSWLRQERVSFYGLRVHIAEPEFEYAIKTNPQLMNPQWSSREKDIADIRILTQIIVEKGMDPDSLAAQVTSI